MSKEIDALIAELESLEKECSGMGRYALPARIKSAIISLRQQQGQGEPAGMVMVPIEPTDAMLTAGGLALGNHIKALVAKDPQQALNAKGKPRGLVIGWKEKMAIRYKAVIVAAKAKQP